MVQSSLSYLLLALGAIIPIVLFDLLRGCHALKDPATWKTLIVLFVLTAIFDNLIVGFGIVQYDASRISGWRLGYAPLEDFSYPVVTTLLFSTLKLQKYAKTSQNT